VGRPRVPSFYALDLERAVRGALPDVDEMQRENFQHEGARLHWPAPLDRNAAIDVLEHDLATLHALLRERGSAGRGRYLLEENAHVARALRARYARFDVTRLTPSDGLVAPSPYVLRAVKELSLKVRPYAPSSLESYAACPLRFFFHSLLGLGRRKDHVESDSLDPAARGTLFHVTLARLAHALRAVEMLPIPADRMPEALTLLGEIFRDEASRVALEIEPLVARVFDADCTELLEDLEHLVRRDFVRGVAMEPAFADLSFGLPRRAWSDPRSVATPALLPHGYLLRGAIDSIERSRDGTTLRVTDYKTGSPIDTGPLVTGGGEKLQAVLYGLAMIALAGGLTHEATVTSSRLYYATRRGELAERSVDLDPDARDRALRVLDAIDGALVDGFFPAWPREKACDICDARPACGADEEGRIRKKRVEASVGRRHLELLRDVRRAP
jgi:ATP-dependent helicase/nuclease subunit B